MTQGVGVGGSVLAVVAASAEDGSAVGFVVVGPRAAVGLGTGLTVDVATLVADRATGAWAADPQATDTMSPAAASATKRREFTTPKNGLVGDWFQPISPSARTISGLT